MKEKIIEKQDEIIANLKEVGQLYFRIKDKATKQDVARMASLTIKGRTLESELIILKAQDISVETTLNQEVEKRIKERMPSDEVNQPIFQRPEKKYTYQDIDIAYATGVFNVVGIDGLSKELKRLSDIGKSPHDIFNSRLTCSEKPNNSKGGEG